MHIVTDSGCDLNLTAEQKEELGIHVVPLSVTVGQSTYQEGPELDAGTFYSRLEFGRRASHHLATYIRKYSRIFTGGSPKSIRPSFRSTFPPD